MRYAITLGRRRQPLLRGSGYSQPLKHLLYLRDVTGIAERTAQPIPPLLTPVPANRSLVDDQPEPEIWDEVWDAIVASEPFGPEHRAAAELAARSHAWRAVTSHHGSESAADWSRVEKRRAIDSHKAIMSAHHEIVRRHRVKPERGTQLEQLRMAIVPTEPFRMRSGTTLLTSVADLEDADPHLAWLDEQLADAAAAR